MKRTVIVSGREAVAECFMTNDKCFAHRPKSSAGENFICNDHSAFGFSDGSYWRNWPDEETRRTGDQNKLENVVF